MAKQNLTPQQLKEKEADDKVRDRYNKIYLVLFIIYQSLVIILNGFFTRPQSHTTSGGLDYTLITTTGVFLLVLVGFGLYFSYLRNYNWSGLGFTFFINVLVFQFYYLINGFWVRSKLNENTSSFTDTLTNIYLSNETFISASTDTYEATAVGAAKCGLAMSIVFAAIGGRAGYLEAFLIAIAGSVGYELNAQIVSRFAFDVGGSMTVFLFGGAMGTILAVLLSFKEGGSINAHPEYSASRMSRTLALIGSVFCWVFFPTLNMNISPQLFLFSNAGIATFFCISTSVVTMVALCLVIDRRLNLRCLITAPIAGGVIVGSSSLHIYNPLEAMILGVTAASLQFVFNKIELKMGMRPLWSNGVFFLFAVQGFLGGFFSSVFRAINKTSGSFGSLYTALTGRLNKDQADQFVGTFISLGLGMLSGLVMYILLRFIIKQSRKTFYQDSSNWMTGEHHLQESWKDESQKQLQLCSGTEQMFKGSDFL